jgi:hypothetical protein
MSPLSSQFPLQLADEVTFNKAQGKTLDQVVVDTHNLVFAHSKMYVALSPVRGRDSACVFSCNGQVQRNAAGQEYIASTDVVERAMLLKTIPEAPIGGTRQMHDLGAIPGQQV